MREFVISGGTLTDEVIFVTDAFSDDIKNFTIHEIRRGDGSIISQLPSDGDADLKNILATFLRKETDIYTMISFAQENLLTLTRKDQDQTESLTSILLEDLDIDTIEFQSGNIIRYTFNGTPDLSEVKVTDKLIVSGSDNASNDGAFSIVAISDGSDYVDVTNLDRSDDTDDETTDAAGSADVFSV